MSAALDLVKSLSADGVEFSTDSGRIRWRNGDGKVTPEIVATLASEKGTVIDFLTGKARQDRSALDLRHDLKLDATARPEDPKTYAEALRIHGPMTYGMAMRILGWGGTRAGQAETALRATGRIRFNNVGRATLTGG